MDLRDASVLYRPMLRPGEELRTESLPLDSTIAALAEICNTLPGIRGYIANVSSLGVRVEHKHAALARQGWERPGSTISDSNKNVAGKITFALQGFPVGTSAQAVTDDKYHQR